MGSGIEVANLDFNCIWKKNTETKFHWLAIEGTKLDVTSLTGSKL